MKEPSEMLTVMLKIYRTLCLNKYFYLGPKEEREHFNHGAVVEGFMEHSKDSENTTFQQFSSLVKILLM